MARAGKVTTTSRRGRTPADDKRPIRWRFYKHLVLIVCEGQTEKLYFETVFADLLSDKVFVRPVSAGRDPLGVAEQAITEREELRLEANKEVDQVWLAFDKDDADREPAKKARFEQAIQLAKDEKMKLAFSNEAFELWLLLHFVEVNADTPLPRQKIYELFGEILQQHPLFATAGYNHKKSKPATVLQAVSELGDAVLAHSRAEVLLSAHGEKPLLETNPSTRVHILLRSLQGWVEFYT